MTTSKRDLHRANDLNEYTGVRGLGVEIREDTEEGE